jgi:hypothetical protein
MAMGGGVANVKFIYLYRDGSNFKKWGDVIFSNPNQVSLDKIKAALTRAFQPDGLFIADQISVPEVFLYTRGHVDADDHCFHEFSDVEESTELPNDRLSRSIRDFIKQASKESERGWRAFDPLERTHAPSSIARGRSEPHSP